MKDIKDTILALLDEASEGAEKGVGYFVGADRLTALLYYAGFAGFPDSTGTGPSSQRARIARRFFDLARERGLSSGDVRRYVRECNPIYGI